MNLQSTFFFFPFLWLSRVILFIYNWYIIFFFFDQLLLLCQLGFGPQLLLRHISIVCPLFIYLFIIIIIILFYFIFTLCALLKRPFDKFNKIIKFLLYKKYSDIWKAARIAFISHFDVMQLLSMTFWFTWLYQKLWYRSQDIIFLQISIKKIRYELF